MNKAWIIGIASIVFLQSPASARTFNSALKLKVYARGSGGAADRVLGLTPTRKGHAIHVPAEGVWYIRPSGSLNAKQLDHLVRVMREAHVPGADLSDHWELTNESLSHLRGLSGLVLLDISRTKITDAGLSSLKSCSAIQTLLLPDTISDKGLAALAPLRHLQELNLDQTRITDHGLEILSGLPYVWNLDLSSTHVTDAGLKFLVKLPQLRRLVLGPVITDQAASSLRSLKSLREIDISQTQIGEKGLRALAELPKLKTVFLSHEANDAGIAALAASPSLQAIDLTRTAVTDDGIQALSRIKTLEEVALSQTAVGDKSLEALSALPELRMLELSDTRVTNRGLAPLARLKKLEVLSLSWQKLTRDDLQDMAKLKQLKTIVLNGVPLSEVTMAQLKHLGSPSPWESIAGLERARFRETTRTTDQMVLAAPVPTPAVASAGGMHPALPSPSPLVSAKGTALKSPIEEPSKATAYPAPSESNKKRSSIARSQAVSSQIESPAVASLSKSPAVVLPSAVSNTSASVLQVASLKDKSRGARWESEPAVMRPEPPVSAGAKPSAAASGTSKGDEDSLLRTIQLQSNPSHGGGFSGLSSMRQLRQTETLASLNTITPAASEAAIPQEEDKPQNFLGEINANARR